MLAVTIIITLALAVTISLIGLIDILFVNPVI
jgi:hypothetical protein